MLKFLADEDFNNKVLRGMRRTDPTIDVARIQDIGQRGADDRAVLELAALQARVLLTHDVRTMLAFVEERLKLGVSMPGVIFVVQSAPSPK